MASPQPEPFVQFSKELFDAILRSPLEGTHLQIVLCVIRRTYGDRKQTQAPISLRMIRDMLGRPEGSRAWIIRCLDELIQEGVIRVVKAASFNSPRILALNKDYETWGRFSVAPVREYAPGSDDAPGSEDAPHQYAHTHLTSTRTRTSPVRVDAPIEDIETIDIETYSLSEPAAGPPTVRRKTAAEWQAEYDRLLAACRFPSDVLQLAELLAEGNKTGQVSVSRIVRELLRPIVEMQDEFSDAALRHGLRAAITRPAPNANYVRKAAAGYRPGPRLGAGRKDAKTMMAEAFADGLSLEDFA